MADYEYRYIKGASDLGTDDELAVGMMRRIDERLANLRDEKGAFYTSVAEFLMEIRMFNGMLTNRRQVDQLSRFSARLVTAVVDNEYGDAGKDRLHELMKDVEDISNYVLFGGESKQ